MNIQFILGDTKFNFRVCAICIKNDKILLHKAQEDSFWGLIGGKDLPSISKFIKHVIYRDNIEK
ncbi:MAG: hypothetical protein ACRC41_06170 [Sarcina sp.]